MKIALVYDVLYPETIGGVEKRIHEVGIRLAQRGHEVHLFPMRMQDGKTIIIRDGLVIHQVCRQIGLYTKGRRSIFQALWYSLHLFPILLKVQADIIDCQNFPYFPVIISRLTSFLKGIPCLITWHECWGTYWYRYLGPAGFFGLLIEKTTLLLSVSALAVSDHTSQRMRSEGYSRNLPIVPNGITLAEIERIVPCEESVDILFLGRFIPEKHPELLIEAIRILTEEIDSLSCELIGDGPMMPEIRAMIDELDLSGRISLPGFVSRYEEVIARMKSARIFVLPSEREGFGIVCLEAMACGLPVITTRFPMNAATDHVLPGCGYAAQADAKDIAAGIRMFLTQKPDAERIRRYVCRHDWDSITCSLEQIYLEHIRKRSKHEPVEPVSPYDPETDVVYGREEIFPGRN